MLPGSMVGGRYLLLEPVSSGLSTLWRAEDEVLARVVAVRILELSLPPGPPGPAGRGTGVAPPDTGAGDGAAERFLAAAVLAGRVTGPQVASVLDAARDPGADHAYVVAEWVDGQPLDQVLREGPMEPALAAAITRAVAGALTTAHSRGVHARRLHPGQVLLCPGGVVKVTDLEVAAAIRELPPSDDPVLSDTEDLGRILHATLTATWPGPTTGPDGWDGLPPTPVRDGRPCLPRQVRAGLPREVDVVVARVLDPGRRGAELRLRTPAEVAQALAPWAAAAVVAADREVPMRAAGPTTAPSTGLLEHALSSGDELPPRRRRWWLRLLIALIVLAVFGGVGWNIGLLVGRVPNPKVAAPLPHVPGQSAGASASAGTGSGPLKLATVTSFDPMSSDHTENEATVADAYDGNATTEWDTEHYLTPAFGNLKTGVGLLVDLGSAQPVGRVVVDAPVGQTMVLYAAPTATAAPATLDGLTAETAPTDALTGDTTLTPTAPTTSRWWVVWITKLAMDPPSDRPDPLHPFSGRITEMAFYPKA